MNDSSTTNVLPGRSAAKLVQALAVDSVVPVGLLGLTKTMRSAASALAADVLQLDARRRRGRSPRPGRSAAYSPKVGSGMSTRRPANYDRRNGSTCEAPLSATHPRRRSHSRWPGQLLVQHVLARAVVVQQRGQVDAQLRQHRRGREVHVPDEAEVEDVVAPVATRASDRGARGAALRREHELGEPQVVGVVDLGPALAVEDLGVDLSPAACRSGCRGSARSSSCRRSPSRSRSAAA